MTNDNTTAKTDEIVVRLEMLAGKTMLPGEPGFVLYNLRTRTQELIAQWHALGSEGSHDHLRTEGAAIWQFAKSVYETAHRYADEIFSALQDVDGSDRQPAIAAGEFVAPVGSALQHLQEAFHNAGSIPEHHFDHITSYLDMAAERLVYTDSAVISLLGSLKTARAQTPATDVAGDDEADTSGERSIPRPPKSTSSRKRPCVKQSGRKRERDRDAGGRGGNERRPAARKLNQYVLDPIAGTITAARPGQEIPTGSRVVEQPAGAPKPSVAAFYDAKLLPAGSTVVARWGLEAPELDPQLVARAGRLAKLAGYGDQARSTMFDQIARSANPTAALEAFILELGGPAALTAAPGTLTTTATRETLPDVIARSVNAGNEKLVEMAENLPAALAADSRLADALADLPGMIESLEADGNGCVLRVRGYYSSTGKSEICDRLRKAGGRHITVSNTRAENKHGDLVRAYIVSARFDMAPIEIAAARTGRKAEVSYRITDDGTVEASYGVDLFGETVSSPTIPCEPSWASVEVLVAELVRRKDPATVTLVESLKAGLEHPVEGIAATIGPVRDLEAARVAVAALGVEDLLGEGYVERLAGAAREIRATDGRRIPVEYRGGVAVLNEFTFHPTDLRAGMLPEVVEGTDGETPTRVKRVRFEQKKGSKRPRITVEEVEVSELNERRASYLEGREPLAALTIELRENFIAEAARSMTATLVNPPEKLATSRNLERSAKNRVLWNHFDPYNASGGDLVHLVATLAVGQGDSAWSRWCRDNVKAFRDDARQRRNLEQPAATDFFAALGLGTQARNFLLEAGSALLSNRLGRDVSVDEFVAIAREARVMKEHAFTAIDRGRALAEFVKRGN